MQQTNGTGAGRLIRFGALKLPAGVNAVAFDRIRGLAAAMALIVQLIPFCVALLLAVGIEMAIPRKTYPLSDRFPGVWFILALPVFAFLISPYLGAVLRLLGLRPLLDVSWLPAWAAILGAVVLIDFLSYWEHRFEHRFWWRVHAVHHASREVHAANNFGHPFQAVGEYVIVSTPLYLFGLTAIDIPIGVTVYRTLHSMLNHSPIRAHLGPLRRIFSDNRYHRIHHSLEERHFDKNFGTIFTIWDQMFGTAYFPKGDEWPDTGVAGLEPPRTIHEYLSYPVRKTEGNAEPANG